jgi:hypothetical protein
MSHAISSQRKFRRGSVCIAITSASWPKVLGRAARPTSDQLGPDFAGPDDVHVVGWNASQTRPAKFVVFFVKDKGAPILVLEK